MIPTFDGESDPRQFLMSFEAAVIAGGEDETTLAKVTCHGSKRSSTTMVFISKSNIHTFIGTIKDKSTCWLPRISTNWSYRHGFIQLQTIAQRTSKSILQEIHSNQISNHKYPR
jgi:hypothetical protein